MANLERHFERAGTMLLIALAMSCSSCGGQSGPAPGAPPGAASSVAVTSPVTTAPAPGATSPAPSSEGARLVVSNDDAEVIRGAEWLAKNGTPADGPALAIGFEQSLARQSKDPTREGPNTPRAAVFALRFATIDMARRGLAPPASPSTPGEIAVWIITSRFAKQRPPEYDIMLGKAMGHPHPLVASMALYFTPFPFPPSLVPAVQGALAHPDPYVHRQACMTAGNEKLDAAASHVLSTLSTTKDDEALLSCFRASRELGKRWESAEILIRRIGEPAIGTRAIWGLASELLAKHNLAGGHGELTPERARVHMERWTALIKSRRADVEAGKPIPLDAKTPRDLVPKGWVVVNNAPGRPNWP